MLQNYWTLKKLSKELRSLIGMKLIACFSQEKGVIVFDFYDGQKENYLYFSTAVNTSTLFIDNNFSRAKHNTIDLCNDLLGDYIQDIYLFENDRIIVFEFINHKAIFNVFGSANANFFLLKKDKIIFTLNNLQQYKNTKYNYLGSNIPHFFDFDKDAMLLTALSKCNLMLGKYYATEFMLRYNLENIKLSDLTEAKLKNIFENANSFIKSLNDADKIYILTNNIENKNDTKNIQFLSLIPLTGYSIYKEYSSISEAIKYQSIYEKVQQRKNEIRKSILPNLQRELRKITKAISIAENINEPLERADKYRNYADLLLAQPNPKIRVGENIILQDWNGNNINIDLDAKFTLIENANRFYVKSRKALEDATIRQKRLPTLQQKLTEIQKAISDINEIDDDIKNLTKYKSNLINKSVVITQDTPRKIDTKFRIFELGDGYTMYVGKNAQNNDELTLSFAKPNDIWLHARGTTGSHCVVKGDTMTGKLPKPILQRAAEITAYYSDARNAKWTPVVYTQKKYVRKSKGSKAGSVILQREDMIMVEPKL